MQLKPILFSVIFLMLFFKSVRYLSVKISFTSLSVFAILKYKQLFSINKK